MTVFIIDVVSDNVCSWVSVRTSISHRPANSHEQCYIGLRRLQKAIEMYQRTYPSARSDVFKITYHPFLLDANAPDPSIPLQQERLERMKGDKERADKLQAHITRLGIAEGISFKFGGRIGRSRDSHRLVELAKRKQGDGGVRLVKELFHAFFEEEMDITKFPVLVEIGVRAGLEKEEVKEWLESDGGGEVVDREIEANRELGITGVPNFLINGMRLDGAVDPGEWYEAFLKVKEGDNSGVSCSWGLMCV
jgi:predicted DsbA family dithiol-disulfide isomerase